MDEPSGQGAVVEVAPMDLHEELVDHVVGPEAAHPEGHVEGAVCQLLIHPAGGDNTIKGGIPVMETLWRRRGGL